MKCSEFTKTPEHRRQHHSDVFINNNGNFIIFKGYFLKYFSMN